MIGGSDTMAPQSSITPIKEKIGSQKVTFHIVPGAGHLGLVVGNKAEELVWTFCHEWLSKNKS